MQDILRASECLSETRQVKSRSLHPVACGSVAPVRLENPALWTVTCGVLGAATMVTLIRREDPAVRTIARSVISAATVVALV